LRKRLKPFDVFVVVPIVSANVTGEDSMPDKIEKMHLAQSDLLTDSLRRGSPLPPRQDQQVNLLPVWKFDHSRVRDGDRVGR